VKVIRFSALSGDYSPSGDKPLGDVRVHDDGTLDPDPAVEDIVASWTGGVMRARGVTDPREIAGKFVERYADWSNGYVVSKEARE
jgi:hypothetical protein